MIFTDENIEKIRNGSKTATRRIWNKRIPINVGREYNCRRSRFERTPTDAPRISILSIHSQQLFEMTDDDAISEGCTGMDDFKRIWIGIYGTWTPRQHVYVVSFRLVGRQ